MRAARITAIAMKSQVRGKALPLPLGHLLYRQLDWAATAPKFGGKTAAITTASMAHPRMIGNSA